MKASRSGSSDRCTVLIAHNHYRRPGGEDEVFAAEADLLRERGHRVVEYVETNQRLEDMGRFEAAMSCVWSQSTAGKFARLLATEDVDVVHFHNTFPLISPSAYHACRVADVPVVQTLHNYRLICPGATLHREGRACDTCVGSPVPWSAVRHGCYRGSRLQTFPVVAMLGVHGWLGTWHRNVDAFLALTECARSKFIEGGLPEDRVLVKPNFLPDPGMGTHDEPFALFVGRLSPEKGVRALLRAWAEAPGLPLKLVGDGPMMDEVRAFVRDRRLSNVQVLGHIDRSVVLDLTKRAQCLVSGQEWFDTFGLAELEALACGTPVVAGDRGEVARVVGEGDAGRLYRSGDSEDLARVVRWVSEHPDRMRRLGDNGRRLYLDGFTPERNYDRLAEIYRRLISEGRSRSRSPIRRAS